MTQSYGYSLKVPFFEGHSKEEWCANNRLLRKMLQPANTRLPPACPTEQSQ